MPFGSEGVEAGVGLALSGGGFRATLFHCGALWRLNELGYLPRLSRISSVSGGSITAGALALQWSKLHFANGKVTNLTALVINPLRSFCGRMVDIPSILTGILLPGRRISDEVEKTYRKHLFGDASLQDLPDAPRFVINSTNLATGVGFRFSKPYAGDYRIGLIKHPRFRLSQAVTASSAFPPVLSPYIIKMDPNAFEQVEGADLYRNEAYRTRLRLTDGGAYDNLGLETVWNRYDTVLASDAGAPFGSDETPGNDWLRQAYRVLNITTNQSRALRKRALISDYQQQARKGTYWGIMTEIQGYGLPDALPVPVKVTRELADIRTRLNPFSEAEQCRLINWGYAVADAAMRRYVVSGPVPGPTWPYPTYSLG